MVGGDRRRVQFRTELYNAFNSVQFSMVNTSAIFNTAGEQVNAEFGKVVRAFWTIALPGRGTLFLYETEDNWTLFKEVFLPMLLTGQDWSGEWLNVNTVGPLDDWHGLIVGGTGEFAGVTGTFLEVGTLRSATRAGALGGELELRLFY